MPTIAPAHDPDATGPRDWRELAALRAAHATMPHAAARAILDRDRVYALTAAQRTRPAIRAAREAYRHAADARRRAAELPPAGRPDPAAVDKARADAVTAINKARAALRASRRPWPLAPWTRHGAPAMPPCRRAPSSQTSAVPSAQLDRSGAKPAASSPPCPANGAPPHDHRAPHAPAPIGPSHLPAAARYAPARPSPACPVP